MCIKLFDLVTITEDLNPVIKKGMIGTIVYIYDNGEFFEVEFIKDGVNIMYENSSTFTVKKIYY